MRRRSFIAAAAVSTLLAGFLVGPRVSIDETLEPVRLPTDVGSYVDSVRAKFTDVVPGAERGIVWRNESRHATAVAIVYIHGFSATRMEVSPLCDSLAASFKANLYYARLTGHGRGGAPLAEASVNDWLNDMYESVEIGRRIGDQVILVGNSTGSTLITWFLATQNTDGIAGAVLMSPNFGPKDRRSKILLWPWGRHIAEGLVGNHRSWEPLNQMQRRFWTTSYPTRALLPMMGLVDLVVGLDLRGIHTPILVLHSANDTVVDTDRTKRMFQTIGSRRKQIAQVETQDPSGHVLAGQIVSPTTTQNVTTIIESYLAAVLADPNWLFAESTGPSAVSAQRSWEIPRPLD